MSDDLETRDNWLRNLAREGKAICPDCDDRTFILIEGEERACPTCQPEMAEEEERERRAMNGQFGAGA